LTEPVPYPASSAAYPVAKPVMPLQSDPSAWPVSIAEVEVVSQPEQTEKPVFFDLKPVSPLVEIEVASEEVQVVLVEEVQVAVAEEAQAVSVEEVQPIAPDQLAHFEPEVQAPISPFEISGTLTHEPQTNSIVVAEITDPIRVSDIFTDAGMILRTGSIDIVPVTTGQIDIIPESPESDVSDSIDSASFVPSVAPLRASGVMNSKAQVGALPTGRRRIMDITITSVTLGIVILTVSALAVIGYMLGVLR